MKTEVRPFRPRSYTAISATDGGASSANAALLSRPAALNADDAVIRSSSASTRMKTEVRPFRLRSYIAISATDGGTKKRGRSICRFTASAAHLKRPAAPNAADAVIRSSSASTRMKTEVLQRRSRSYTAISATDGGAKKKRRRNRKRPFASAGCLLPTELRYVPSVNCRFKFVSIIRRRRRSSSRWIGAKSVTAGGVTDIASANLRRSV